MRIRALSRDPHNVLVIQRTGERPPAWFYETPMGIHAYLQLPGETEPRQMLISWRQVSNSLKRYRKARGAS